MNWTEIQLRLMAITKRDLPEALLAIERETEPDILSQCLDVATGARAWAIRRRLARLKRIMILDPTIAMHVTRARIKAVTSPAILRRPRCPAQRQVRRRVGVKHGA